MMRKALLRTLGCSDRTARAPRSMIAIAFRPIVAILPTGALGTGASGRSQTFIRSYYRRLITILLASAIFFSAELSTPANAQEGSGAIDGWQIVNSSIAITQRHWRARQEYAYLERQEIRHEAVAGRATSVDTDLWRTVVVKGVQLKQLVERNGHPPSHEIKRKEQEEADRLKQETPGKRAERIRRQEEETLGFVREIPRAFEFQIVGEDVVNGRPAYVLRAEPDPRYQARGKYGKVLSKASGKLWIDKEDFGLLKFDGKVSKPFSMGIFLARVRGGASIRMEQMRVDKMWLPARVEVRAAAKVLFVKNLLIDRIVTYSEYSAGEGGLMVCEEQP